MAWTWQRSTVLNTTLDGAVPKCQHPGLLLDRFTPREALDNKTKRDWLDHIAQMSFDDPMLKSRRDRWVEMVERSMFGALKPIVLQTSSRLIVGLGAEHALKTAITLDRGSGAPIIPGSALKGVARTFALISVAQQLQFTDDQVETALNTLDHWLNAEKLNWDVLNPYGLNMLNDEQHALLTQWVETFRDVFGYVGAIGRAVFFNAIYDGGNKPFEVDVMTPHFSKYYIEGVAPSDDQNPVPVPYLVVKENQPFLFAIGSRTLADVALAKQGCVWLREGLFAYGVGAKTAQGYGVFRKTPQKG